MQTLQGPVVQLVLGREARVNDGRQNPAAGFGDFLVGLARQPHLKLVLPPAAEHKMGVRVNEPGQHDPLVAVDVELARLRLQVAFGNLVNPAVPNPHRPMLDDAQAAAGHGQYLRAVVQNEIGFRHGAAPLPSVLNQAQTFDELEPGLDPHRAPGRVRTGELDQRVVAVGPFRPGVHCHQG